MRDGAGAESLRPPHTLGQPAGRAFAGTSRDRPGLISVRGAVQLPARSGPGPEHTAARVTHSRTLTRRRNHCGRWFGRVSAPSPSENRLGAGADQLRRPGAPLPSPGPGPCPRRHERRDGGGSSCSRPGPPAAAAASTRGPSLRPPPCWRLRSPTTCFRHRRRRGGRGAADAGKEGSVFERKCEP